jgi:hypothetical protein
MKNIIGKAVSAIRMAVLDYHIWLLKYETDNLVKLANKNTKITNKIKELDK